MQLLTQYRKMSHITTGKTPAGLVKEKLDEH